ncbi:nucleotidyltransferase [Leucothrix sargassi]|nr:nucleotidyltransferase [Leucothrix sargassi]
MRHTTKYAELVEKAKKSRSEHLTVALESAVFDSLSNHESTVIIAKELDSINKHITVDSKDIDDAASDYEKIAECLIEKLNWPEESIRIFPQGSSSTQTLINSPDASKFDIDAVCAVNISLIDAEDPMAFYDEIGRAISEWEPKAKKRCWTIEFSGRRYYVEFTPSVPLDMVPPEITNIIRYSPTKRYREKALAVVNTPTESWKTSNPEGFTDWVSEQAERVILTPLIAKNIANESASYDSIDSVPDQEIPLSDTLRIAIRLSKRHRDMAVHRGYLEKEFKPISVIIVTLLTQCYEGLADQGSCYSSPVDLLLDLVQLMPGMIESRNGEYWIENPTVENENFAEKWNEKEKLREAFFEWCKILVSDLKEILESSDEKLLREKLKKVFGCTGAVTTNSPLAPGEGLTNNKPSRVHNIPATTGLA